jgi:hypothetical protein
MTTRRTFLAAGIAGGAALAVAYWLRETPSYAAAGGADASPLAALDRNAPAIVAALVPVVLDGALPARGDGRAAATAQTVDDVGRAIAGLAPAAQRELAELFSLLGFAPARIVLAGVRAPWTEARPEEVAAFLERWRTSRWMLLRSAYDALHQLIVAAWYGNPQSWPTIGYPGPPAINR